MGIIDGWRTALPCHIVHGKSTIVTEPEIFMEGGTARGGVRVSSAHEQCSGVCNYLRKIDPGAWSTSLKLKFGGSSKLCGTRGKHRYQHDDVVAINLCEERRYNVSRTGGGRTLHISQIHEADNSVTSIVVLCAGCR